MAKLADLLTGPTARRALAHRDVTAVFRILRDAGVNQLHIARATGQQQSEVSAIIGELRSGLHTAQQAISLAKDLRSVSVLARLAPLQEAAAARRDSSCQDLARQLATLRSAA